MYRNPAAHEPRLHCTVANEELLELLTTLWMVHRRLDSVHVTLNTFVEPSGDGRQATFSPPLKADVPGKERTSMPTGPDSRAGPPAVRSAAGNPGVWLHLSWAGYRSMPEGSRSLKPFAGQGPSGLEDRAVR